MFTTPGLAGEGQASHNTLRVSGPAGSDVRMHILAAIRLTSAFMRSRNISAVKFAVPHSRSVAKSSGSASSPTISSRKGCTSCVIVCISISTRSDCRISFVTGMSEMPGTVNCVPSHCKSIRPRYSAYIPACPTGNLPIHSPSGNTSWVCAPIMRSISSCTASATMRSSGNPR